MISFLQTLLIMLILYYRLFFPIEKRRKADHTASKLQYQAIFPFPTSDILFYISFKIIPSSHDPIYFIFVDRFSLMLSDI